MNRWLRGLRHAWADLKDSTRALPDAATARLAARIAASETRHSGEVRICVETALPPLLAWRIGPGLDGLHRVTRERALHWFAQLRIWDTEHNNGVLIYLLLTERVIEVVADRGLARHVTPAQWRAIVDRLGERLRAGDVEEALSQALEAVSALLVEHHPVAREALNPNELPDAVLRV